MTNAELIAKLQLLPQNLKVVITHCDEDREMEIDGVYIDEDDDFIKFEVDRILTMAKFSKETIDMWDKHKADIIAEYIANRKGV